MVGQTGKDVVDEAVKHGCSLIQFAGKDLDQSTIDKAHSKGLRCNVVWTDDPKGAAKVLEMGADTILTDSYQLVADATGLK